MQLVITSNAQYHPQAREECLLCSVGIFIVNRNGKHHDTKYVKRNC